MQALLTSLTSAKVKTKIHTLVLCALVVFTFPVVTYAATMPPEVLAAIEANYPDGLPRYLTPEEQQWLDEQRDLGILEIEPLGVQTPAPTGTVWTPGEYEPLAGVLVAWESYTDLLTDFIVEVSQSDTDAKAYVVVDTTTERTSVTTTLTNAGANMSNVVFLVRTTNSVWIRDYGPRYFYEDSIHAIMDHTYNRPTRPDDNAFPSWLAGYWSDPLYDLGITHGGGNFHSFSNGDAFMSTLVLDENSGYTETQMKQLFNDYLNVNLTIYPHLLSNVDATGHIDMWFIPLSDNKVIISEFPSSHSDSKTKTDNAAADLTSRGYTVYRTPAYNSNGEGSSGGTHYTYTNAAIVNNKVFVPIYGGTHAADDTAALSVYQTALPDHEIIPFDCASIIGAAGAVHCVMKHVYAENAPVLTAPTIVSTPVTSANTGMLYTYDVYATGYPEEMTYSLTTYPAGMTIDPNSGIIDWTPSSAGNYDVNVVASNGESPDATQNFSIYVAANPFPDVDIPVLMYHKVDDVTPTTYWVSTTNFRDQLSLLYYLGYETVDYEDLYDHITGVAELPAKPIILTFDDSYQNAYTHALPVTQEFTEPNFFGAAHIITDWTGDDELTRRNNDWDSDPNGPEPVTPHLIWPEVGELYDAGWAVEAHSRTHKQSSDPTYDPVYEAGSAAVIASKLGIPDPNFYPYPFGQSPPELITALQAANYLGGVDAEGGIENTSRLELSNPDNIWHIRRIGIMRDDSISTFASKIGESVLPTLTVNVVGNGSVQIDPDQPYYAYDTVVTLTAIPEPPYGFDSWSGGLTGNENPDTITMDSDKTVTATFVTPTAPTITSTPVTSAAQGQPYTYDVEATGNPVPTYSLATYPSGMTINSTTGLIQWTPASTGDFYVDVVASNGEVPDANQGFTITVSLPPTDVEIIGSWVSGLTHDPCAGSDRALVFTAHVQDNDVAGSYVTSVTYGGESLTQIAESEHYNNPYHYYVTAWILDEAGIAAASGSNFVVVWSDTTPDNAPGYSSVFLQNVDQTDPVGATDTANCDCEILLTGALANNYGDMVMLTAFHGGNSASSTNYECLNAFTEALEFYDPPDSGEGMGGYKAATGVSETPSVDSQNNNYSGRQALVGFVVQAAAISAVPPVITSTPVTTATVNQLYTYDVDATGIPAPTYSLTTFPTGMTINTSTGEISWTPTEGQLGPNPVVVRADNSEGFDTQSFSVDVAGVAPVITSAPVTTATVNQLYTYNVDATGIPAPTYSLTTFPAGMTINSGTGEISWTPTEAQLNLNTVTVEAGNGQDPNATQTFDVDVAGVAPVITSAPVTTATVNQLYTYNVDATGIPAPTYSLTTFPAGMTINSGTGEISWTPTGAQLNLNTVTVEAGNGEDPNATQTFDVDVAGAAPVITSAPVTTATVNQLYTYNVDATGIPAPTYSLTTFPAGMTINTSTGEISWTPTEAQLNLNTVTVEAGNGEDPNATQTFDVDVAGVAPVITSAPVTTATVNQLYTYNVDATGIPAPTYSLTTFPAGMTINTSTGEISWTPTEAQLNLNTVTVEAGNGEDPNATQTFDVDVAGVAPVITSAPVTTATVNQLYTYNVDATGIPAPTYSLTTFPAGMTINTSTGEISWTPTEAQLNLNTVTVEAGNGEDPNATQTFDVDVAGVAPVITSAPVTTATVNQLYTYNVDATGIPAPTYSLTTFPAGMTINTSTGEISWTPTEAQLNLNTVTVEAGNGEDPNATQTFDVDVAGVAPVITSSPVTTATVNQLYTYNVDATGIPAPTYSLTTFPAGMTINTSTGEISWTPTEAQLNLNTVTVEAGNGEDPNATQTFDVDVAGVAPVITSAPVTTATVNQLYTYNVDATGIPAPTYSLTTFPAGMTINTSTGEISWTPTEAQLNLNTVTVEAGNGEDPNATQTFDVDVAGVAPVITSSPVTTATVNQLYTYNVDATGIPAPTYSLTAYPAGMTINTSTGEISWTPTEAQLNLNTVTVEAGNGEDPNATQTFDVDVAGVAPVITSAPVTTATVNQLYTYNVDATGIPAPTYSLTTFPAGMTINASTGEISWTPTEAQLNLNTVTVEAGNGEDPNATQTFDVDVAGVAPVITSTPVTTATVNQLYTYNVDATGIPAPTYSLTTFPAGMTINTSTGEISWTPTEAQLNLNTVTVEAGNGEDPNATQTFDVDVAGVAPVITSSPVTTATVNQLYTYNVDATGIPAPTYSLTTFPAGMTINASTGEISWTPTEAQLNLNTVTVEAGNGEDPNATQTFDVDVAGVAPQITSAPVTTATVNQLYTYDVDATGIPAPTYSLTAFPAGMTINTSTGEISWTPTEAQLNLNTVTVEAGNGEDPNATQTFDVDVAGVAPQITSAPVTTATVNQLYTYDVDATGIPAPTYSLTAFPAGMTINTSTGEISWTPTEAQLNLNTVTVEAGNGEDPNATQTFDVDVAGAAPVITSAPVTTATVNQLYTYDVDATGIPAPTYSLTTFPAGMTINTSTGEISWTPTEAQLNLNTVTVEAGNGEDPNATQTFDVDVAGAAPVITSSPVTTATVNQLYTYNVDATGIPAPTYSLTTFPAGMTINASTGEISWTPTEAQLNLNTVTVEAGNGEDPNATQTFDVDVAGVAPVITSTPVTTATVNQLYTYDVDATGIPAPTYSLTTYPAGMTINTSTGEISWTPTEAQLNLNTVTVEAGNGEDPNATQTFDVDVAGVAPQITSAPVTTATVNQLYTYDVDATGIPAPTYSLTAFPAGMTINTSTGEISWTPTEAQLNLNTVTVEAGNGEDPNATQTFDVDVAGVAPVITSSPVTTATVNQLYTYNVDATGIPAPTYSLTTFPAGMTINASTGEISWTPTEAQLNLNTVTVEAGNGEDPNATQTFDVDVAGVAPVITSTPVTTATVNQLYTYNVDATGIPAPTYSLTTFPAGMTINTSTGEISWTPTEAQLNLNTVTVEAGNGEDPNATQSFSIAVLFLDNFDDNRRSAMWRLSIENYDKARVVEEANQLNVMAASQMDLVSSCVGHWKMNDNDDQNQVDDSSGNDNHGTAQQITSTLHTNSGNPPYLNGALTFNGSSDYITTPMTNFPSGAAERSASLWIKWDGSTSYSVIFGYGDDAAGIKLFGAFLDPTGNLYCWNDYQNPANNHDTGIDIAIGDWTHIVLTYDGTNVRAYKDGALVDTTAKALDTVLEESTIGKNIWAGLHHFAGSIDNVMIFNKELSQDEISYLYNNGDGTETMPGYLFTSDYIANGWSFDVNEDFALEVDFHYGSFSDQDGWVGIAVENDDSYFSISAGSDSNESYFYYESIVDGNTGFEQAVRDSNDGTLYISYDADSNSLYLSHTGYGDANAYVWQTAPDPLQGQSVNVAIGGGSAGAALGLGDAYLDNFEVTTAALLGWPPATDLDSDGFIGWGDVKIMSEYWLDINPGDINGDGIVNFKDFSEFGLAW